MRILLASLLLGLACGGQAEVTRPEPDPTLNGAWSGTAGTITVRYDLRDLDGTVSGNFEVVVPNALEGDGQVTGGRSGARVRLDARIVLRVPLEPPMVVVPGGPTHAAIESGAVFDGTLLGNRIAGEIALEGGEAEGGTDETGRPIGVRITDFQTPITLVRR